MTGIAKTHTAGCPADNPAPQGRRSVFRRHPLMVALCLAGLASADAQARDYFNPAFLDDGSGTPVDLSAYEQAGAVPEGSYLVDVYINQQMAFTRQIRFVKDAKGSVQPELTLDMLKKMGVATDRLPGLKGATPDAPLSDLATRIPGMTENFNLGKLRLDLTVPQVSMLETADGAVDPSLWDEGVPGMMFNYMLSGSRNQMDGGDGLSDGHSSSLFGTVNGGANLGAWRLRSTFNYNNSETTTAGYHTNDSQSQFLNTYLQRDVQALRGELTMGESSTGSDIFDSVPFRGAQLTSEDNMLPTSQRSFAPVVTGIANSTAKVSVRQNGVLIYETTVPPGPFRLTDIYNPGDGGTLEVTVTEADGTAHISTQNYSSLNTMKRPGTVDYELTAGRYHGNNGIYQGSRDPLFALATATVGLPYNLTLYGGLLMAEKYQAIAAGTALSLGLAGAVSLDATLARASVSTHDDTDGQDTDNTERGVAWRLRYSKNVDTTGTSLDVSATRYSSSHYLSFQDAATSGYDLQDDQAPWLAQRQRSNWQVNLSQQLGSLGTVFVRGNRSDYWNSEQVVNSVGAGFSSSIKGVSYSLNYDEDHTRSSENGDWPTNKQISLNVSVPFSLFNPRWDAVRDIYANYTMTHDNHSHDTQQTGLSGSFLDNKLSWNASQSHDNQGGGTSGNLSLGWQGDRGNVSANYGYGPNTTTVGGSANGAVVVHPHGVAFTNMLGDAMALVEAPGAPDVKVSSGNTSTDRWGYAVVPYLQTYQRNTVSLDTTTLPDGVDIPDTSATVYPTKGAIVEAKFKPRVGRQAMLTLLFNGKPVPFGAMASLPDEDAQSAAIVGDDGMVYLTGAPQQGVLTVRWGTRDEQQCRVNYDLGPLPAKKDKDKDAPGSSIVQQQLTCVALAPAVTSTPTPTPTSTPAAPVIDDAPVTAPVTAPGKRLAAQSLPLPDNKPQS